MQRTSVHANALYYLKISLFLAAGIPDRIERITDFSDNNSESGMSCFFSSIRLKHKDLSDYDISLVLIMDHLVQPFSIHWLLTNCLEYNTIQYNFKNCTGRPLSRVSGKIKRVSQGEFREFEEKNPRKVREKSSNFDRLSQYNYKSSATSQVQLDDLSFCQNVISRSHGKLENYLRSRRSPGKGPEFVKVENSIFCRPCR